MEDSQNISHRLERSNAIVTPDYIRQINNYDTCHRLERSNAIVTPDYIRQINNYDTSHRLERSNTIVKSNDTKNNKTPWYISYE